MKKNRITAVLAAAVMLICVSGCSDSEDGSSVLSDAADSTEITESLENPESDDLSEAAVELPVQTVAEHRSGDDNFYIYPSNTVVSTGNNYKITKVDSVTYRAYFPVEEYGELEYCFYFSNSVDSTYDNGSFSYVGFETGDYTIESARIGDGGTSPDDEITGYVGITFDGEQERTVLSGESFWSDPVSFSLEEGHYLVWEWTISGENVPCTYMSNLTSCTSSEDGEDFVYCDQIPLPQLIGASREVGCTIAAIGDSITQGCQTDFMAYEFWAAQISQKLGSDYALYNAGLGWARADDAAQSDEWIARVSEYDIVLVAFGTNDLVSGEYGGDGSTSADEIEEDIRKIAQSLSGSGCSVVIFNAPPFDYDEETEAERTMLNETLKTTCSELGVYYFDFASYLCDPDDPAAALYGGHPNGEGGNVVSDAFIDDFTVLLGK